jgi:hypothetical protein
MSHPDHGYKLSVLDEIDSTTPRAQDAPPTPPAPFDQACAMEQPLERIRNFTAAIARLAPTIDDEQAAGIIQALTLEIAQSLDELDNIHGYFFHLHHPDRERFEREGWPSEQAEADHD